MKRKLCILIGLILIFSAFLSVPAFAYCDGCETTIEDYDWSEHCDYLCSCKWSECGDCGEETYLYRFCYSEHEYCDGGCGECIYCSDCTCPPPAPPDIEEDPEPIVYMSLYELWHALGSHLFKGVAITQAIDLFATIATAWTCIAFVTIPLRLIRGGKRR